MHDFVEAWRKLGVRPRSDSGHPERTDERYCFWDDVHRDYVYTQAFVQKLVRTIGRPDDFRRPTAGSQSLFTGRPDRRAIPILGAAAASDARFE